MPRRHVTEISTFDRSGTAGAVIPVYRPGAAEFGGWVGGSYAPPIVRYLAPGGNDTTGLGTIAFPYRTFSRARADLIVAQGGDVIYLPGLYDYPNCAPGIDESHGITTTVDRKVRIMGPGVAGKLSSEMAHITNFTGNNWQDINTGCYVGNMNWVEVSGLWIDCANTYSMGLHVQGDHHLYDSTGRFRRRGRMVQGIRVVDNLVENSRQTNMNLRGNLWNCQVLSNISRAPGRDGGFVGEGIYFGTEPKTYGDDEAMSVARSYHRLIAEGGSTTGTTNLTEIDTSSNCVLQGNTIDLAYPGGISQSECVEIKPLAGTRFLEFDNQGFTSQVWAPGAGPLLSSLTRVATTSTAIYVTFNTLLNAGRTNVMVKGTAWVEANVLGPPTSGQPSSIAVGRQAYQGNDTGFYVLYTGDVGWVKDNTIDPGHNYAIAFCGEFTAPSQDFVWCGNTGPPNTLRIWPTGAGYAVDGATNRNSVLAEFGDPRSACV